MLVSRARRYMFVFVVCVRRTLRQGENHQSVKNPLVHFCVGGEIMLIVGEQLVNF